MIARLLVPMHPFPWRQPPYPKSSSRAIRRRERRIALTRRIIHAYDSAVIRAYCTIRFVIINLRMLDEIEQYMPKRGTVLDLGCGFGLFSTYFALCSPKRRFVSLDLSPGRIVQAKKAAERLGCADRIQFASMNVLDYEFDQPVDGIVLLDIIHHLPTGAAPGIIRHCAEILRPGGVLLIKDVEAKPYWKAAFTWALDKLMDFRTPVNYYHKGEMLDLLKASGFEVTTHQMVDVLPYPHIFYICRRKQG